MQLAEKKTVHKVEQQQVRNNKWTNPTKYTNRKYTNIRQKIKNTTTAGWEQIMDNSYKVHKYKIQKLNKSKSKKYNNSRLGTTMLPNTQI